MITRRFAFIILILSQKIIATAQVGGTLLIAGVGNDGLVMVADSRGSTGNKEGKLIAG